MRTLVRDALNLRAGNFEKYSIQNWTFVRDNFATYEALLEKLVSIDHSLIEDLSEEQEGTAEQWAPIFENHKETWRLLVYNKEVVGYWHFIPLNKDFFIQSTDGTLKESEIDLHTTVPIIGPGNYDIFVSMFAMETEHKTKGASMLQLSFVRAMKKFTSSQIFFSGISACALSVDGIALCQRLGMKNVGRYQTANDYEMAQIFLTDGKHIAQEGILSEVPEIKRRYARQFPEHVWLKR
ncbi:MAG: hypothetical protein Pars93KO_28100 [Parasphingorhabdus sp.]